MSKEKKTSTCKPVFVLLQGILKNQHTLSDHQAPLLQQNTIDSMLTIKPDEKGEMNHTLKQETPIV